MSYHLSQSAQDTISTVGHGVTAVSSSATVEKTLEAVAPVASQTSNGLNVSALHELTSNVITLMGISFILGVLFTTFLLLVLDFMRRNQPEE
jgi:hypothetical protein